VSRRLDEPSLVLADRVGALLPEAPRQFRLSQTGILPGLPDSPVIEHGTGPDFLDSPRRNRLRDSTGTVNLIPDTEGKQS
jgi:hypothetical protein